VRFTPSSDLSGDASADAIWQPASSRLPGQMSGDVLVEVFEPAQGLPAEMRATEIADVITQPMA
jgi:hypothetical protein